MSRGYPSMDSAARATRDRGVPEPGQDCGDASRRGATRLYPGKSPRAAREQGRPEIWADCWAARALERC